MELRSPPRSFDPPSRLWHNNPIEYLDKTRRVLQDNFHLDTIDYPGRFLIFFRSQGRGRDPVKHKLYIDASGNIPEVVLLVTQDFTARRAMSQEWNNPLEVMDWVDEVLRREGF